MKRNLFALLSLIVLAGMILAACGGAATEAPATEPPAPVATEPPATEAPTEPPAPAYVGDKTEAADCSYGGEFKSIEAVDQYTVKFTLCYPDPAFLSKAAFSVFAIQDKDYLDAHGGDSLKMSEDPNGTGPYKVKEWVRGDHITFEANTDYWNGAPANDTLIFRWSAEAAQRLLELQAGTVDGIFSPSSEDYAAIQADSTLKLFPFSNPNVFYLGMNNTMPPFDNDKVRQAVAMAIDKQRIIDTFYPTGSYIAEQFVPEDFYPGFSKSGDGAKWTSYDPEGAKKLLAEAGFPNGFEVTLSYRDVVRVYLPHVNEVAQDIQAQLADVGIKTKITKIDSAAFTQSVSKGEQPLFMYGWGMDYPDSTNFYDYHFASDAARFGKEWPDLVTEIKAAAQLGDPAERQKHYDVANALIKEHIPMVPIAHGTTANAFKASVGNVVIGALNINFHQMTTDSGQIVWMQSLWCGDESDGETLQACLEIYEPLLSFELGGTKPIPALAETWDINADATEWTFHLRQGVKFQNGADLDANDVVASYVALWDAASPNHKGNSGVFEYLTGFFGQFLNAPK